MTRRHPSPRRRATRLVGLSAAVLAATGLVLAGVGRAPAEDVYEIKFGTVAPEGTPWSDQLQAIKKRVEKESGGRIQFKLFTGGMLGGEVEMVKMLRRGRIQGFGGSLTSIAEGANIPELMVVEFPYLFESFDEADYILDDVIFDDMSKIFSDKGFFLAQWHENGWRSFASKGHGIHTPEDMKSLKMRSQESPLHLATYRALGVQAESIPMPEVLSALQTGMVDGFDNTALFSQATGWYEGVDHFTMSEHIYQPAAILYNAKFWADLPDDLRKIVLGDVKKETEEGRAAVRGIRDELLQNFRDAGIEITELTPEERKAFRDLTRPVHEEFADQVGRPLLQKIYKGLEEFRARKAGTGG